MFFRHYIKIKFSNKSFYVDIPWYNPYRGLTMLHYNPTDHRLYFFDSGKLLSVNVRIEENVKEFSEEQVFDKEYYNLSDKENSLVKKK